MLSFFYFILFFLRVENLWNRPDLAHEAKTGQFKQLMLYLSRGAETGTGAHPPAGLGLRVKGQRGQSQAILANALKVLIQELVLNVVLNLNGPVVNKS